MSTFSFSDLSITKYATSDLLISFRTPSTSNNPIHPATSLQLAYLVSDMEIYPPDRLTARDVVVADDGLCTVLTTVPTLKVGDRPGFPDTVVVELHAWKGERLLGRWEAGTLRGKVASAAAGPGQWEIVA